MSKSDIVIDKAGESVAFEGDVGRVDYEEIVGDLVDTTMACCERALPLTRGGERGRRGPRRSRSTSP